eukprot:733613-Amphidinium_carterae.1
MASLSTVQYFDVSSNFLAGLLPEEGLATFTDLYLWAIALNSFSGVLPVVNAEVVIFDQNYLQGTIPSMPALYMFVQRNLFAGSLPQIMQNTFVSSGSLHEGTMPASLSRLSANDPTLVFGHGLAGTWPQVPGTLYVLSLPQNALQGHLPELHLDNSSVVLLESNHFSCMLPRNGGAKPRLAIALLGNRFTQPTGGSFPAWVYGDEQGSMFCVSEQHGRELCWKFGLAALFLG